MAVDYDLVVLGGSLAGRQAAIAAALQGARVALVEPTAAGVARSLQSSYLRQVGTWQRWRQKTTAASWQSWQQWTEVVSQQQAELRSPQILLSRGVDYMQSAGKFCPGRGLALEVGQRWLTARAYLLAADFFTPGPPVAGLTQNFYTPETLHSLAELPQRLAVLGGTPAALAIAQLFAVWAVR
ncbi:MAG: FAD-dependent oxidoreductase [Leptolyngbyaceae cyanobacterium SM1_1_3]|nr:FAD-dependent oxidoreductase [Leptolyngbyaceae cyanobacterium SM1_1_3]